jgi:hypothetical protein
MNLLKERMVEVQNFSSCQEFTSEPEIVKRLMPEYFSGKEIDGLSSDKWYWSSELVKEYFNKVGWPSGSSL